MGLHAWNDTYFEGKRLLNFTVNNSVCLIHLTLSVLSRVSLISCSLLSFYVYMDPWFPTNLYL